MLRTLWRFLIRVDTRIVAGLAAAYRTLRSVDEHVLSMWGIPSGSGGGSWLRGPGHALRRLRDRLGSRRRRSGPDRLR